MLPRYQDISKRHPLSGLMQRVFPPFLPDAFPPVFESVMRDAGSAVFLENRFMKKFLSDVMMYMISSAV